MASKQFNTEQGYTIGTGTVTTIVDANGNVYANYLTATANITSPNVIANTGAFYGSGAGLTNIPSGNITGQVANALVAGTVYTNAQPNITSVGTLTSLAVTGNISGANLTGNHYGSGAGLTSIPGAQVTGTVANATYAVSAGSAGSATTAATVTTNAQPNITSVGTLTGLTVGNATANTVFGNGTITLNSGLITGNGAGLSSLNGSNVTGTVANATYAVSTNSATYAGTVTTASQPNITSIGNLTSLTMAGPANLGPVGNVTITGGSSGLYLQTNGSGALSWGTPTSYPSGSNTQIQYNNAGSLAGSAAFTFNNVSNTVSITGNALIGSASNSANYANAQLISSQATTGATAIDNIGHVGEAVANTSNASITGIGIFGIGKTANATKATGVQGQAKVTSSTDTGAAVGVRGLANDTHIGGYNIGVLGNATGSGYGNYAFYIQNGGVASIENPTNWELLDGTNVALTFTSATKANIFGIDTTLTAEGIYSSGYANITGNLTSGNANLGNLVSANYFTGTLTTAAQPNITSVGTLTSLAVTGNISGANLTGNHYGSGAGLTSIPGANVTGTVANATYAITSGAVANAAQPNITSVGNLTSLAVTGNITSGNANLGNLVIANYHQGTLTTAAQPNITSVGTLTSLGVSGTITGSQVVSNVATGTAPLTVTSTTLVSNLFVAQSNVAVYANVNEQTSGVYYPTFISGTTTGNYIIGSNANFSVNVANGAFSAASFIGNFTGNGSGLTSLTGSQVVGTVANATYAVSAGSATTAGTVTTNAQPNITSVGTLTSLTVSGTGGTPIIGNGVSQYPPTGSNILANAALAVGGTGTNYLAIGQYDSSNNFAMWMQAGYSNSIQAPYHVIMQPIGGNVSIGANVSPSNKLTVMGNIYSNANVSAGYFIGNGSQLTGVISTANSIVNGTSNVVVAASGNVTFSIEGTSNVIQVSNTAMVFSGANISGANVITANSLSGSGAGLTSIPGGNVTGTVANATYAISAGTAGSATTSGTVTTAAQSNITSVGTLTSLGVSGNVTAPNVISNTGAFYGSGAGLTSIPGGNVTGTVANATYAVSAGSAGTATSATTAATVTTNAQPNITSVGTLTSLTVTGNITASYFIGNGSALTSIPGAQVTGTVANATYATSAGTATSATTAGTVTTNAQPNITSVGTLTSLSVTGNLSAGNATIGTGSGGNITGANVISANLFTGTLTTAAQPNITSVGTLSSLTVTGNTIMGNLTVTGNVIYIDSTTLAVEDPIIQLQTGANGAPLTSNTGYDVGTALNYYTTTPVTAFMGWKSANAEFFVASNVSTSNNVTTINTLGNLRASYIIANGSALTSLTGANVTGTVANSTYATSAGSATSAASATTAGTVTTNVQPNITSVGTLTSLGSSGNITAPNVIANTGAFYGSGAGLTSIPGANVTGTLTVPTTSYAATVSGASQANITTATNLVSVGTITSGTWSATLGAISGANLSSLNAANVTGTFSTITTSANANVGGNLNVSGNTIISNNETVSGNLTVSQAILFSSGTIAAAGTNQGTSTAITADNTYVSSGTGGVILPTAVVGREISITNNSGATITVYPASGASIEALAANTGVSLPNDATLAIVAKTTTNWWATTYIFVAGTDISLTQAGSGTITINDTSTLATVTGRGASTSTAVSLNGGLTTTTIGASGNITAPNHIANTGAFYGSGAGLTSIPGANVTGTLSIPTTSYAATVSTASQPNITSVGTLTSLAVSSTTLIGGYTQISGYSSEVGIKFAGGDTTYGLAMQPSTDSTTMVSFFNAANTLVGSITQTSSNITFNGLVTGANVTGTVANATYATSAGSATSATTATTATTAGTVTTSAQPNITSVGTLTVLGVSGNVTAPNVVANTGAFYGSGAGLTSIPAANISGTVANATYATSAGSATTATSATSATTAGTVTTASQPNITSVGTLTSLTVSGNILPSAATNTGGGTWYQGAAAWGGSTPATTGTNSTTGFKYIGGSGSQLFTLSSGPGQTSLQLDGSIFVGDTISYNPASISGATDGSLLASGSIAAGGNIYSNSYAISSINAAVSAAGTVQANATALSTQINVVSTVSSGAGVELPSAVGGMRITIMNTSANSLLIYPASGAQINSLGANAAYTQQAGGRLDFIAVSNTQWYTMNATYG